MTHVQDAGVDELTGGTGSAASVGADMLVEHCLGGGGGGVSVDGGCDNIMAGLAAGETGRGAGGTAVGAFGAGFIQSIFIKTGKAILDTFIIFKIKLNSRICDTTCCASFRITKTFETICVTKMAFKTGAVGIGTIWT